MAGAAMLKYLQRVDALLDSWRAVLSESEVSEVQYLIEHSEPAEGLRALAWIIHDGAKSVTVARKRAILDLCRGLVDDADMPDSFRGGAAST